MPTATHGSPAMSYVAIAAALALEDVSAGERLAAFSLASYANREHRAWPGTAIAAARAGLSRSQYLAARDSLQKRGLVVIEKSGGGRGNSPVIALVFAQTGPWLEGQINAPLFEAVLGRSRSKGSAKLLLAALADDELAVADRTTEEIRTATGMADSTYRRARAALLASGELELETAGGGRAKTNQWLLRDPRGADPLTARTRVAPGPTARPLIATTKPPAAVAASGDTVAEGSAEPGKGPELSGVPATNPGQNRTVYALEGPELSGVYGGVSELNPPQSRTVYPQTPPQTPPETPPPSVRAGREPQNLRTFPPSPPDGGSPASLATIVEDYLTDRGRRRQRTVTVDLATVRAEFAEPRPEDLADWQQVRSDLQHSVSESVFELWLEPVELVAADSAGCLLLACPLDTRSWVAERFGHLLERAGRSVNRQLKVATDREMQLLAALADAATFEPAASPRVPEPDASCTEARGRAPGRPNDRAAWPSSPVPSPQQTRAAAR
jgi:hypothetical protein